MEDLSFTKIFDNGVFKVLQFQGTPGDVVNFAYRKNFTPADQVAEIGIIMSGSWMLGPHTDNQYFIEPAGHSDHLNMEKYTPPGKPAGPRARRCLESGTYVCCSTKNNLPFNSRRIEAQANNIISTNPNDLIVMPKGSFTINGISYSAPVVMSISTPKNITVTSESIIVEFWLK